MLVTLGFNMHFVLFKILYHYFIICKEYFFGLDVLRIRNFEFFFTSQQDHSLIILGSCFLVYRAERDIQMEGMATIIVLLNRSKSNNQKSGGSPF